MSDDEASDMGSETGAPAEAGYSDPGLPDGPAEEPAKRVEASRCLADAALTAALAAPVAERLAGSESVALTVRVPSAAWVMPLASAFKRLAPLLEIIARDGSNRTSHKADSGNDEVGRHLSRGRSVVGIANSLAMLPRALVTAADAAVEVKIDTEIVSAAIARHVGESPVAGTIEGLGALDFHDMVSAFRANSTADGIVERLRLAAQRVSSPRADRLPRLIDALEYGPAQTWGLGLSFDFSEWKAGKLPWRDVGGAGANALFAGEPFKCDSAGERKTHAAKALAACVEPIGPHLAGSRT